MTHLGKGKFWIQSRCRYLPTPLHGQDVTQFLSKGVTGVNLEFSFSLTCCLTKAKEPILSCFLPIAGRRIIKLIPFRKVFVLCEMQSTWSRNWTHVDGSISDAGDHYTTGTAKAFEADVIPLKSWPCVTSCLWQRGWVNTYKSKSKVGDLSQGWPEGSLFNSYHTEV